MDSLRHDAHFYTIPYINPLSTEKASGLVVVMEDMIGVVVDDIAAVGTGVVQIIGGFDLAALVGENWAMGTQLYWDAGNEWLTSTAGANVQAGRALEAKIDADTTALVWLNSNGE